MNFHFLPDSGSSLADRAAALPVPEAVQRVLGQMQRREQVDPADLHRVLGEFRGIEVGPTSIPAWMTEKVT